MSEAMIKLQAKKEGGLISCNPPIINGTPLPGSTQIGHRHISIGERHQQQEETPVLYSSEKVGMDYVTVAGINTRTGVEQHQLAIFVVRQLVDNALDDL
ncbi:MAG: hypothetical protein WA667_05085 [Candidatus Nitrosopolaris sp.]